MIINFIQKHFIAIALLLLMILCPAGLVYYQKHSSAGLDNDIRQVRAQINHTRDHIAMLHVEWSAENQPEHLASLVRKHADYLQPTAINQFVSVADLPKALPGVPHAVMMARLEQKHRERMRGAIRVAQLHPKVIKPGNTIKTALNGTSSHAYDSFKLAQHAHPSAITAWRNQKDSAAQKERRADEAFYVSMSHQKKTKARTAMQTLPMWGRANLSSEIN